MKNLPIVGGQPLAEGQDEYHTISMRREVLEFSRADGKGTYAAHCMTTRWRPTPEELTALLNGGDLYLRILGTQHPPIALWVE